MSALIPGGTGMAGRAAPRARITRPGSRPPAAVSRRRHASAAHHLNGAAGSADYCV